MIEELQLSNYRGFQNHTIPFKDTSIVVGPNNAGKSTVVEALRLLSIVTSRFGAVNFSDVPRWLSIPRSHRGFAPSLKGIDFNDRSIFHKLGEPPAEIKAFFDNGVNVFIYVGYNAAIHSVVIDANGKVITTKGLAQEVELPQISIQPQVAPVAREELILDPGYAKKVIPATWSSAHFRNQINLYPEYYEEFKRLVEGTWKDLRIINLEGKGEMAQTPLLLTLFDHNFATEIGWVGHGLQMWLQTMWFLARSKESATIILDEPDVYMHADLQRKLIKLLKSYNKQIIVATHSVEIMAEAEPEEILVVNRRAQKSVFAGSIPSVQSFIQNLGSVHNLQLARIWHSRKLILVEGPDDVVYLRRIHSILLPKSQDTFDTLPIIELGGWSGWKHATGYPTLVQNAFDEAVLTYCLFDSDYFPQEIISERMNEAKKKNIQIHVWKRKEMENYFVVPAAIQRLIVKEIREGRVVPSTEEIEAQIIKLADDLKDDVIDNIATYIQHYNTKLAAGTAHRQARQKVDSLWNTFEGKISLVSGKQLITKISAWSQQNYGVIQNGERILRHIKPSEIDKEVVLTVSAIDKGQLLNI